MTPHRQHEAYRRLVEQLVHEGWYRAGADRYEDDERIALGGRVGHLLDADSHKPSDDMDRGAG